MSLNKAVGGALRSARRNGNGHIDSAMLALELALLSSGERTEIMRVALQQRRRGTTRESVEARIDNLLAALDLMEEEMRALQREAKRRAR